MLLEGLQLSGSSSSDGNVPALVVAGGELVVRDCIIDDNTGAGALRIDAGSVKIINSRFEHNSVSLGVREEEEEQYERWVPRDLE